MHLLTCLPSRPLKRLELASDYTLAAKRHRRSRRCDIFVRFVSPKFRLSACVGCLKFLVQNAQNFLLVFIAPFFFAKHLTSGEAKELMLAKLITHSNT